MSKSIITIASLLLGCSSLAQQPETCLAPRLAPIEANFVREAIELCEGYTWVTCPDQQYLIKKYDAQRAVAVEQCR